MIVGSQVVGAKIVTNSKAPGAQCFGLVTMSTSEEAAKCISHLHRTELHGRTITVDRVREILYMYLSCDILPVRILCLVNRTYNLTSLKRPPKMSILVKGGGCV